MESPVLLQFLQYKPPSVLSPLIWILDASLKQIEIDSDLFKRFQEGFSFGRVVDLLIESCRTESSFLECLDEVINLLVSWHKDESRLNVLLKEHNKKLLKVRR